MQISLKVIIVRFQATANPPQTATLGAKQTIQNQNFLRNLPGPSSFELPTILNALAPFAIDFGKKGQNAVAEFKPGGCFCWHVAAIG